MYFKYIPDPQEEIGSVAEKMVKVANLTGRVVSGELHDFPLYAVPTESPGEEEKRIIKIYKSQMMSIRAKVNDMLDGGMPGYP
ncbi:MAG TPA: hypothetical protein ENI56_01815 [Candidatus Kaiserbacteria bacterium]|nr:hypothetical protein [Candidatus Kaiserbacteria bacterium]